MSPAPGIPSDVRNVSGPLIITFMLGSILYGVSVLQVYTYYLAFPKDRKAIKFLVYFVFLLDTIQSIIFFRDAYTIFGPGFGDMAALRGAQLSGVSVPIITGLVSFIVQSFYCYQIQVISRSWLRSLMILSIALTQFVAAIVEGVFIFKIDNSAILQQLTLVPCTIWLVGSALCDTIIAIAMTYHLISASSGLKGNVIITRLVRLIIETGSLTATVATIDAVLFIAVKRYPFHMIPSRCLAKLYSNTLMVILNSRVRIQGGRDASRPPEAVIYSGFTSSSSRSGETIRFARNRAMLASVAGGGAGAGAGIDIGGGIGGGGGSTQQRTVVSLTQSTVVTTDDTRLDTMGVKSDDSQFPTIDLTKKYSHDSF